MKPLTIPQALIPALERGQKTQHRVLLDPQPDRFVRVRFACVSEDFAIFVDNDTLFRRKEKLPFAVGDTVNWKPADTMPQWASRYTYTVKAIRVERACDISEEGAQAEGFAGDQWYEQVGEANYEFMEEPPTEQFRRYWTNLHGPDAWEWWCEVLTIEREE